LLTDTTFLTLTFLVYAFVSYAMWPPVMALMAEVTPAATRGFGYSILLFVEGLMASAAPVLAAWVIELLDIWVIFPFSVALLVGSVLVLQLLDHRTSIVLENG
jgi:MFS family permease